MDALKNCYNEKYLKKGYFHYREWLYRPYIKSLLKKAQVNPNTCILDVGCGQGFFCYLFSTLGLRVYGVDKSVVGIRAAMSEYGNMGINFFVGDMTSLPFSNRFETVFVRSCSLYNNDLFPSLAHITKQLFSCVKEKGRLIFCYPTKPGRICLTWRNHTIQEARSHFSYFPDSRIYYINKIDCLFLGHFALNPFITGINQLFWKRMPSGLEIVVIIQK